MANPELKVRISGDLRAIRTTLQGLQQQLEQVGVRAGAAGRTANSSFQVMAASARQAMTALRGFIGAYVGLAGIRSFVRAADQAATLNAQLRLATREQGAFNRAYAATFDIAQRSRTSLQTVVDLYASLERSTRSLGINQETLLALTETISQAAALSGGGPGVEAALIQLGQGLAEGTLRGDELNSVLSQAPRLAQAIADGLGIPIEKLREMSRQGKITAAEVARALLQSRDSVARDFAELPRTVGGAFTQLQNHWLRIVERLNKDTNFADALIAGVDAVVPVIEGVAGVVSQITQAFRESIGIMRQYWRDFRDGGEAGRDMVANLPGFLSEILLDELRILPTSIRTIFTVIIGEGDKLLQRLRFVFVQIAAAADASWAAMQLAAALAFAKVREVAGTALGIIGDGFAGMQRRAADFADAAGMTGLAAKMREAADGFDSLGGSADRAKADAANARAEFGRTIATIEETIATFRRELDIGLEASDAAIGAALAEREAALEALKKTAEEAAAAGGALGVPGGTNAGAADRAAATQAALLRDSIERSLKELQRLYEAGEIGLRDYFRERERLQLAAIDTQIAQAEAEARTASSQEAQAKALAEVVKLQRDRAEIGPATARELAEAERKLANLIQDVEARLAEARGDAGARQRVALEREMEELRRKAAQDPNATALIDQLFNVELARSRAEAIRAEMSRLVESLRSLEENSALQMQAGVLGQVEGERRIREERDKTIAQLAELRQQLLAVLSADPNSQAATAALRELDAELLRVRASQQQFRASIEDNAVNALSTFFSDLATAAKDFKTAFLDMVRSFVAGVAQMLAQQVALRMIRSLMGGLFGGGGALGTATQVASVGHGGMLAGHGMRRTVRLPAGFDPWALGMAPRFHSGGLVGLKPGEVPAILQTGERVLSRRETAAYQSGDRPAPGVRLINVFDPKMVADFINTADGERVFLNFVDRNASAISQRLGGR